MSSNYTKDSLHGNPECGVDLDADNTICLERIFDTLFVHADDKIEGRDKFGYKFKKVESLVNSNIFDDDNDISLDEYDIDSLIDKNIEINENYRTLTSVIAK